jgi:hypothetical protein
VLINNAGVMAPPARQATEPLLYAAADPGAVNGGYYGPSRWFGLVGPSADARPPHRHHAARQHGPPLSPAATS